MNKALQLGYFGQSNIDRQDPKKTILEELHFDKSKTDQEIRNIAGNLLFTGDLAKKKIAILSGGEKARVNLGKILLERTNILLLDEPTNHLDYESVEALISAIQKYEGAVLTVAHDENFLQKIATKLIVFDDDEVFVWNGNYQDFIAKKGFQSELESGLKDSANVPSPDSDKKLNYNEKKELQKSLRVAEREFKKVEMAITTLEKQQAENQEKVHTALRQGNRLKLETLGIEAEKIQVKISREFEKWEVLGVKVEVARGRLEEC
jgi:ATP-binding cassette subfamily F protein 3